jgi:Xaa-Pro dipeptidase
VTQQSFTLQISPSEFDSRVERLLAYLRSQTLSGVVLFDNSYVGYLTGFVFFPTERPIALAMSAAGERVLFVPRLEMEHAQAAAHVDRVESYAEYPGNPHPLYQFKKIVADLGLSGRIGADSDGYPWILGYQGPSLSSLTEANVLIVIAFLNQVMAVKSAAELALCRESVKWGNLAFRLLQRYTRAGANETEVSLRASTEATLAMIDTLGPLYRSQSLWWDGANARFHGQIGRNSADPHVLTTNATFMRGDVVGASAHAPVWGYAPEVERTMFVGEPSEDQVRYFEHAKAAQDVAFDVMRPGVRCCDVDRAVRAYFEKNDLMPYWRHHSGHSTGLRNHEAPFLDSGDDTVLEPGMLFSVEPGLYVPALGGFRHADTVVITQSGIEILTYYPRDLSSLTIPA